MTNAVEKWATWQETHSQPEIWAAWGKNPEITALRDWISGLQVDEIWLCGAGTSAYIGDILAADFRADFRAGLGAELPIVRAVPTTDLVARPSSFLNGVTPLVISFGRSGNSTETIGTLDALDALAPMAPRLNITCNKDGALATRTSKGPQKTVILPDATHDVGFAMTSSFSTMFYTALGALDTTGNLASNMTHLAQQLKDLLPQFQNTNMPKRAVYLGTGPLAFAAREAALKVMELSAGQIPSLWESTLGFRHGPKSFVTDDTLITVFKSPEAPAKYYEDDLIAELRQQFPKTQIVTIGPDGDIDVAMPFGAVWAAPICVAAAQVSATLWANELGLNVDNPFAGQGTLSRVVSGVKLYPVEA